MLVLTRKTRKRVVVENHLQSESTSLHSRSQPVDKSRSTGHPAPLATCPGADAMPDLQNLFTQYRGCPSKINFDAFVNELANRPDILRSIRRHASDPRTRSYVAEDSDDHALAAFVAWAFVDLTTDIVPLTAKVHFYDTNGMFACRVGGLLLDHYRNVFRLRTGMTKKGARKEDTHDNFATIQQVEPDHREDPAKADAMGIIDANYSQFVLDQLSRLPGTPTSKLIWCAKQLQGHLSHSDWYALASAAFPNNVSTNSLIADFLFENRDFADGTFATQYLNLTDKAFSKQWRRAKKRYQQLQGVVHTQIQTLVEAVAW